MIPAVCKHLQIFCEKRGVADCPKGELARSRNGCSHIILEQCGL